MAYNVVFKKSVERDLRNLPAAEAAKILDRIERDPAKNPSANPMLKGQFAGLRKYRTGDYRVVYALIEQDVLILRIGHRQDAYRGRI